MSFFFCIFIHDKLKNKHLKISPCLFCIYLYSFCSLSLLFSLPLFSIFSSFLIPFRLFFLFSSFPSSLLSLFSLVFSSFIFSSPLFLPVPYFSVLDSFVLSVLCCFFSSLISHSFYCSQFSIYFHLSRTLFFLCSLLLLFTFPLHSYFHSSILMCSSFSSIIPAFSSFTILISCIIFSPLVLPCLVFLFSIHSLASF